MTEPNPADVQDIVERPTIYMDVEVLRVGVLSRRLRSTITGERRIRLSAHLLINRNMVG